MLITRSLVVHLFHILFVGGLFLYLGIRQNAAPAWLYPALLFLGIAIIIAHGLKLIKNRYSLISWFHVLIVAPLVLYIGRTGPHAPQLAYKFIFAAGILAIGDHAYWLARGAFF
jgi:uncharacterized membrane protein